MKLNLFTFFQKHYLKLIIFFSFFFTYLFVIMYQHVPSSDNFDYIIYILAILYSFTFFVIGIFQTIVLNSIEKNYQTLKLKYLTCIKLTKLQHTSVYASKDLIKNINSDNEHIKLQYLNQLNVTNYLTETDLDKMINFYPNSVKVSRIYYKVQAYLKSKNWDENKIWTKIVAHANLFNERLILRSFKKDISKFTKHLGDRLDYDIISEKEQSEHNRNTTIKLEDIEYTIEEILETVSDISNKLD